MIEEYTYVSEKIGVLPTKISQTLTSETPQRKRLWTKPTTLQKVNVEVRVNIILYVCSDEEKRMTAFDIDRICLIRTPVSKTLQTKD